jgi:hypothetical protein
MTDEEAEYVYIAYLYFRQHAEPRASKDQVLAALRELLERHGFDFSVAS